MEVREARTLRKEVVSKTAFLYATMLVNTALGYGALFLSIRHVGELEYAVLAFALSFEGVFLFITDFGFARSHTKRVSEGCDLGDCVSVFALVRIVLSAAFAVVVLASLFIWESVLGNNYGNPDTRTVILVILVYNLIVSIRWTYVYTFYAQREVAKGQAVTLSEVLTRFVGTVAVVILGGGAVGLSLSFAAAAAVSILVALYLARRSLPRIRLLPVNRSLLSEYIRFATPISIAVTIGTIALYLDKVIIEWSLTPEDTGAFFASQRLLAVYVSLGSAVSVVVFPSISKLNSSEDASSQITSVVSSTIRTLSLVVIPLTCFLAVFSESIVTVLLSEGYSFVALPFSILAISYGLFILTTPFQSQMLGMGYASEYSTYSITYGLLVISLDILLIPSELFSLDLPGLGLVGAATALLVAQILNTAMFFRKARTMAGLTLPTGLAATFLGAIVAVGFGWLVVEMLEIENLLRLAVSLAVFSSSFLAILFTLRVVVPRDLVRFAGEMIMHLRRRRGDA